jgi:hypothetical protein
MVILMVAISSSTIFAADVPSWMRQAASASLPTYERDVPAVVLHNEQQVTLGSDGKLITTENFAVKLLTSEGRNYAIARAYDLVSAGKIASIEGWLLRPDGSSKIYDKKAVLDIIADADDVYNEGRIKIIDASREVDPGAVFGFTVVSEDAPLFYQDTWNFQGRLPTVVSRYSLSLPQGWKASSITFNTAEIKPQQNGSTYTWEMRNLAPIPPEPLSPAVVNLAPRIAVNYAPDSPSAGVNRAFSNWLDVSRWATSMHESQVIVDDAIAIKARDLTATAKTEFEKIQAIGSYVQNLQYISIDIGVGHGNGYKPRSSTLVLSRGYGDCKDKANLMRALLKSLNIEAYPIAIFSGDSTFVREEWASPRQFNHCIIAVKLKEAAAGATTVLDHPKLGKLLIFDATDPYTPVGDLPDYLQGSLALIIAGENGGLSRMPLSPPEHDTLERQIDVSLDGLGAITGKIRETAYGQTSSSFRREMRELSVGDYRKAIEGWLSRGSSGAQLVNMASKDRQVGFDLDVEFKAPRYGQLMQNRLLVFKPVIVGRRNAVALTEPKRTNPIELDSGAMKETVTFTLPAGFVIDEMPDPVNIETNFGNYQTRYEAKDGKLVFNRKLTMNRTVISSDKYSSVKDFFTKMLEAEQSPVILIKK